MNERTKELAEQAGFKYIFGYEQEFERFAELIRADERDKCAQDYLQDCADAVEAARLEERGEVLMALDSDLEHGVKWLSEKACAEFKKNCPELNKLLNSWSNHETT